MITLPIYDFVRKEEGGVANLKDDTGGLTKHGVTHLVYDKFRGKRNLPLRLVTLIEEKEVFTIYNEYWEEAKCDLLDWPLNIVHFSFAFNAGPFQATRMLQRALGVTPDGDFGPITQAAVRMANASKFACYIAAYRLLLEQVFYYDSLDVTKPENTKFLTGFWLKRIQHTYQEIDRADSKLKEF